MGGIEERNKNVPAPSKLNLLRQICSLTLECLAVVDGDVAFNPPEDPAHVSYTVLYRPSTRDRAIHIPVQRLQTIINNLGHTHIDIHKMDIESAEHAVIDDLLTSHVRARQILVECHHRFPQCWHCQNQGVRRTSQGNGLFPVRRFEQWRRVWMRARELYRKRSFTP